MKAKHCKEEERGVEKRRGGGGGWIARSDVWDAGAGKKPCLGRTRVTQESTGKVIITSNTFCKFEVLFSTMVIIFSITRNHHFEDLSGFVALSRGEPIDHPETEGTDRILSKDCFPRFKIHISS